MATAQSKLDILINAKNQASPAVNQLKGDFASLDKSAGNLARGLGGLATGAGIAGIVALGGAAVGAGMDMARLAAYSQDVEASMQSLAAQGGESAKVMMDGLRESSRGAISDYDLMLTANRAMLLGVSDNTQQMVALMDVARARSQALGVSTAEAFGDIVTGIGRMSPLILDNLGITVDQAQANEIYAKSIGKVAGELSEQEKKQALVNAVLKDSAALVAANVAAGDDAASNFERMDAAIANAKSALGELFAPSMAIVATDIANAAEAAANSMKEAADEGRGDWLGLIALTEQAKMADQNAKLVNEDFEVMGITAESARAAIAALGATGVSSLGQVGLSADAAKERLAQLKAQADETAAAINSIRSSALGTLESAASQAVSIMGSSEVSQIYSQQKERLDAQIKALEAVGYNTDELKFKSQELAEKAALPFTTVVEAAREAEKESKAYAKSLSGELSDAAREAEAAFNQLQGTVAGVLSSALQHDTGVDPDAILEKLGIPRPDAINESARRLADIAANGLKGQDWLGDFASDVPDIWRMIRTAQNPQEEAAYLLRDFQDGLLTSAIDKGKAKEIVKRQILGDQNMAALAQEIATELAAEMNVPLSQALAATQGALGTGGGGAGVGTSAAQQFTEGANAGLDESNAGGTFIDKFIAQTQASYSKLKTAGSDAGKQWGNEFLATVGNDVPPGLVRILVDLTTPGVIASIAQKGSLTGAAP